MKKILLLVTERSSETKGQINDLYRIYGDDSEIKVVTMSENARCQDIMDAGKDYDILAGDFSMDVLTKLINPEINEKPIIHTTWQEEKKGYKYLGMEKVKMEMVVEKL